MTVAFEDTPPRPTPPAPTGAPAPAAQPLAVEFEEYAAPTPASAPAPAAADVPAVRPQAGTTPNAEREAALALVATAEGACRWVDLWSVGLGASCGLGLGAATRIEEWTGLRILAVLSVLGCIAVAVWIWRWARAPAELLGGLPIPVSDAVRTGQEVSDEMRAKRQQRRVEDLARINEAVAEVAHRRACLQVAVIASIGASVLGWVVGIASQADGAALLGGSAAAAVGAVIGWRLRCDGWPLQRTRLACAAAIPPLPLVMAVVCGAGWWTILGVGLAVAGGWGLGGYLHRQMQPEPEPTT